MGMDEHQRDVEIEYQGEDAPAEPEPDDAAERPDEAVYGPDTTIGDGESPGS